MVHVEELFLQSFPSVVDSFPQLSVLTISSPFVFEGKSPAHEVRVYAVYLIFGDFDLFPITKIKVFPSFLEVSLLGEFDCEASIL